VKSCKLFHLPGIPASDVSRSLGAVNLPFGPIRRSKLLIVIALALDLMGVAKPSYAQTVFSCSGFASTASSDICKVSAGGASGGQNFAMNGGATNLFNGVQAQLQPPNESHTVSQMNWQQAVNVQAFTTTFTFVFNGQFLAFVLNNNTNSESGGTGPNFSAGAGCEGGFYQAFDSGDPPWPNNVFAMNFDGTQSTTDGGSFTYSSVQIFTTGQDPCNGNDGDPNWVFIPRISTYPIPLNSPATTPISASNDVFNATITYDGSDVVLNLYDVTAGGSCPGSSCFTHTWTGVNIPSIVGANTAYVGFTDSTESAPNDPKTPLYINSFSYTVQSPGLKPGSPTELAGTIQPIS